jgi:hypothetical protein
VAAAAAASFRRSDVPVFVAFERRFAGFARPSRTRRRRFTPPG